MLYASIFAKKYGMRFLGKYGNATLVRCLNERSKRTNVPYNATALHSGICNLLTTLRTVLEFVRCIVTRVPIICDACSDF